jgi:hypothetical protein
MRPKLSMKYKYNIRIQEEGRRGMEIQQRG